MYFNVTNDGNIYPNPNMDFVDVEYDEPLYKTINPKKLYKKIFKKLFDERHCFPNYNNYELYTDRLLGAGSYGNVYLGYDCYNNKYVSIKQLKLGKKFYREIKALRAVGCSQNTLCYYDYYEDEESKIGYIMTEYINGQTLNIYMKHKIDIKVILYFFEQLINGVEFIHDHNYAHRDLKPENIIVDNNLNLKIIDFGTTCSKHVACDLKYKNGTAEYMPPESLSEYENFIDYNNSKKLKIAKAHDIWSLSVIFYQMLNNMKLPYETYSIERNDIYQSNYESSNTKINKYLNTFINDLIVLEYKNRYDIHTIKDMFHKLFKKIKKYLY